MSLVMDSSALIGFLTEEPGADVVEELLRDGGNSNYVHAVNLCEVYYEFLREGGYEAAEQAVETLLSLGLVVCEDMDPSLWRNIGAYKVLFSMSLADCFCLALAGRESAQIVTSDHEFDEIANQSICPVRFIR